MSEMDTLRILHFGPHSPRTTITNRIMNAAGIPYEVNDTMDQICAPNWVVLLIDLFGDSCGIFARVMQEDEELRAAAYALLVLHDRIAIADLIRGSEIYERIMNEEKSREHG